MPELQRLRHSTALRLAIAAALMSITAPCFAEVTESQLAERDAESKRVTAQLMAKPTELTQPLQSKYSHVIADGQSLASAAEGWPALSVAPRYDNLMLGQSPRSAAFSGASFKPVGEAAFTPLRAVVQQKSNAAVVLDAEKVGKLAPQAQEEGESVEVGALNMARRLYLHHLGRDTDPEHLFVASNASTSGRSIAQLSKTGGTNEYLRVTQAVDQAKALADAQQASYSISAFFWLQGEYDYSHTNGGKNDQAYYKAKLRQLRDDLYADTAKAIAGQEKMPAFFSYQTDAKSSVKDGSLAVGMAQWELAQEEPGWYLVGPVYPYTDKGVHLSANGYRWFGQMLGKVYHHVVIERKEWVPLSPRQATLDGRDVLIDFHVPHPPLAFDQPYIGHEARDVKNKGFMLQDDQGEVPIAAVEIVADTIVRLRADRERSGKPRVSYAGYQVGGAGQLRDSDPMRADATYEYLKDLMPAEANIKALVHQPYPLQNWGIAFDIEVAGQPGTEPAAR